METITKQEIETLKQVIAQANPNGWTDWPGHGKSKRTHIGYLSNYIDGGTANIALFETNTNAKRADVLLAIYARNYLEATIIEIEHLRAENARLTAEVEACENLIHYCDIPDWALPELAAYQQARAARVQTAAPGTGEA